jgi:hypothetical protein
MKEGPMERLMIVARLKEGAHEQAEALLRKGPPFDPEALGLHRHAAYITAREIVFLFEAPEVEWIVNDLIDDSLIAEAFAPWESIVEGTPRGASERYYWSREESKLGVGLGA